MAGYTVDSWLSEVLHVLLTSYTTRLEPIMLKSSPIILSSNSKNNHLLFFIPIKYLIFPYYSCGR